MAAVGTINMHREGERADACQIFDPIAVDRKVRSALFFRYFYSTLTVRFVCANGKRVFLSLFRCTQTRVRGNPVAEVIHDSGR